jgi:hypothetical protein
MSFVGGVTINYALVEDDPLVVIHGDVCISFGFRSSYSTAVAMKDRSQSYDSWPDV